MQGYSQYQWFHIHLIMNILVLLLVRKIYCDTAITANNDASRHIVSSIKFSNPTCEQTNVSWLRRLSLQ